MSLQWQIAPSGATINLGPNKPKTSTNTTSQTVYIPLEFKNTGQNAPSNVTFELYCSFYLLLNIKKYCSDFLNITRTDER